MIKILGILDLFAAILFILIQWEVGLGIAIIFGIYLIIKSLFFLNSWATWLDLASGGYMLLVVYDIHSAFSLIFVLWLLQKSFFSLAI